MTETDPRYYQHYDLLYAKKDYRGEAKKILEIFRGVTGESPGRILDVGCGTGSHTRFLAEDGAQVVGTDIDCKMVEMAEERRNNYENGSLISFFCGDINDLNEKDFDLAVSLFHVVTYIPSLSDLRKFFGGIEERLKQGGLFIFDCWNGLAALLDPPRREDRVLEDEGYMYSVTIRPSLDRMQETVLVKNDIIASHKGKKEEFSVEYTQRLWPPRVLGEVLEESGFDVLNVGTWDNPKVDATEKDWKILFVCRKM